MTLVRRAKSDTRKYPLTPVSVVATCARRCGSLTANAGRVCTTCLDKSLTLTVRR